MRSEITWFNYPDHSPPIDTNVIVACADSDVTWGMLSNVEQWAKNDKGLYENTKELVIQWGQEENGFEYWNEIKDIVMWAYFPKSPIKQLK